MHMSAAGAGGCRADAGRPWPGGINNFQLHESAITLACLGAP